MPSPGVSLDAAIAGLNKGIENARNTASQISVSTEKLQESTEKATSPSEEGKGGSIDVTV